MELPSMMSDGLLRQLAVDGLVLAMTPAADDDVDYPGSSSVDVIISLQPIQYDHCNLSGVDSATIADRIRCPTPTFYSDANSTATGAAAMAAAHLALKVVVSVVLTALIVGIVVGNACVILSVAAFDKMRTLSNGLIASLASADLLVAIVVLPLSLQVGNVGLLGGRTGGCDELALAGQHWSAWSRPLTLEPWN